MKRPLEMAHDFLAAVLDDKGLAIDATMGNGNDTVFLAKLAREVYAFDVQEQALKKTREHLDKLSLKNVQLILDGHEHLKHYVSEGVRAAIFNLGYLPNADKSLITRPKTTLKAIQQVLDLLEEGGRLSIMVYYGHPGGDTEKNAVLTYVQSLPQKTFAVMLYQPLNQINTPPFLLLIEKLKKTF